MIRDKIRKIFKQTEPGPDFIESGIRPTTRLEDAETEDVRMLLKLAYDYFSAQAP